MKKYNDVLDESRCSNVAITADENFNEAKVLNNIGTLIKTRGFSSVKFIPWRENEIIVLKTEEIEETATYMMIFDLEKNKVLMPDTLVGKTKFEGMEFI